MFLALSLGQTDGQDVGFELSVRALWGNLPHCPHPHVFYAGCTTAFRCRARVFAPLFWVGQNSKRGCVDSLATGVTIRDMYLAIATG